jgi:hypothetical protein
MSDNFEFGSWPDNVDARHDDTGRRRWSERTRSYQIVWVAREFTDRDQQKKLN